MIGVIGFAKVILNDEKLTERDLIKDEYALKIKVLKEITGLGLVEAKGLVDKCPSPIKENITPEEAEEIKKKLTDAGATVEVK